MTKLSNLFQERSEWGDLVQYKNQAKMKGWPQTTVLWIV